MTNRHLRGSMKRVGTNRVAPSPPSNLRASIEGERHEVHAIGAHTAAKENRKRNKEAKFFCCAAVASRRRACSPALRAEISIAKGEAPAIDSSKPSASSTALANPLDAMDTDTERSHPTWLHAGAHQAEAGFQDPTLGWIGVRAMSTLAEFMPPLCRVPSRRPIPSVLTSRI